MNIELNVLHDIEKTTVDEEGNPTTEVIHKDKITRFLTTVEHINYITEDYDEDGNTLKDRCQIHIDDIGFVVIAHSYEWMKEQKTKNKITGYVA